MKCVVSDCCKTDTCIPPVQLRIAGKWERLGAVIRSMTAVFATILGVLAVLICRSVFWVLKTWSNLSMDEIVYHLKTPLEGTNGDMIVDYVVYCVVPTIIVAAAIIILFLWVKNKRMLSRILKVAVSLAACCVSYFSINHIWDSLDVSTYVESQNTYSSFIDGNYVDPSTVTLTFPEKKRNLIYIFLESMEMTYADSSNGGSFENNIIPELTDLSNTYENFSGDHTTLNGGQALTGATWTIGAMFAQTSGLPLSIPMDGNDMSTQSEFIPGAVTLGDVLEQEGYRQELLIGSDAAFGGRDLYFGQHGNYEIYDHNYSLLHGEIPEGYHVFWGYEDQKLFENAKTRLNELAQSDQPFNLTMLTVDTHFEDGYVCDLCQEEYGYDQYSNVMACSSRQVDEFVRWIQQQPFYENTTIVISGDHLTMDKDFCKNVPEDYTRKVYTTYINAAAEPENDSYREYSTMDNFPTTLAALGVEIPGNHLGLGTNLFSDEKTLVELYGAETVSNRLTYKSELMDRLISYINNANVLISDYDTEKQRVVVRVNQVSWDQEVEGIRCEIGKEEDEGDFQIFQADQQYNEIQQDNVYRADIFVKIEKGEEYCLNIYAELADGTSELIKSAVIQRTEDIEEAMKEDGNNYSGRVQVGEYDPVLGELDVYVDNLQTPGEIMTMRCAVWAAEDQSDIRWYEGEKTSDSSYVFHIYASDFNCQEAVYNVHAYAISEKGTPFLIGSEHSVI